MIKFKVLQTCKIADNRELVLSLNDNNEYVLATRVLVPINDETKVFYEKGAIIIGKEFDSQFADFGKNISNFEKK